ncbi:DUF4179 domain-containing protein [uncultured Brevibacillus sp.]|uniref:DUF4179 domain-containing protein n=1 Tax=uncultured Brevibacillus sp. TaxID=169970 RepID=UPI002591D902|nr:DUF4179 domain-containing protein [uncultured Brevibacillus sp.]
MTCLDKVMLDAFLEDQLSFEERQEIQHHLMTCSSCLNRFEQYMDGLDMTDNEEEEWQTEEIVQNVMEKLPAYPLKVLRTIDPQSSVRKNWKKRSVDILKKTTIAVAGLAVIVTLGTAVSPTFASYVSGLYQAVGISSPVIQIKGPYANVGNQVVSLFDEKETDRGILAAAAKGFVKPLDLKATDQGLTVEAKAVLADPLRLTILGSVTKKDGTKIDSLWKDQYSIISNENVDEFREIRLKDKNGNILTPFYKQDVEPFAWTLLPNGENFVIQRDLNNFFDEKNPLPDELVLELRVKRMGDTKGTWNLDIPIDMRPAKAATKTVAINKQFTTPHREKIDLKETRYAPSGTQIIFSTSESSLKETGVRYQLINEQGAAVGSWDDTKSDSEETNVKVIPDISHGGMYNAVNWFEGKRWIHSYVPLDSAQNTTLKLDAVFTKEKAYFQTKLPLSEIEKKPLVATGDGNRFIFRSVTKKSSERGTTYLIKVEGRLAKGISSLSESWKATDEQGDISRIMFFPQTNVQDDGTISISGDLKIISEKKDVKEFTITYDHMIKEQEVDWNVPLKQEK